MSISRQEEVVSVLWIIASLLAFMAGYDAWGWIFAIKAALDTACAVYFGIKEVTHEHQKQNSN